MPEFKILVVDDQYGRPGLDRDNFLARVGREESAFLFATGQTDEGRNVPDVTLNLVERLWECTGPSRLSMILLDVRFRDSRDAQADRFGFALLRALRGRFGRALPIVMLTNESEVRGSANEAAADGFLPKDRLAPDTLEEQVFRNGLFPDTTGTLVGSALPFLLALRDLRCAARKGIMELLLLGETGTGKSELARYIHRVSGRTGPFTPWYARPANYELHSDELFGHWKGAFDGATTHMAGRAEEAHLGTLFIDEIAEMHPKSQSGLLEYRQRNRYDNLRRIMRLGHYPKNSPTNLNLVGTYSPAEDRVLVDALLVTATNQPIDDPAWRHQAGFRLDLFNSLGHRILVPPLRERVEDIAPLFLAHFERCFKREIVLTPDARAQLEAHEWREGNIREVETVVENVKLADEFDELYPHHFAHLLAERRKSAVIPQVAQEPSAPTPTGENNEKPCRATEPRARLVDIEVQSIWGITESLRSAVIETRRPGRLGTLSDIFKHATGVEYATSDVKREVKEMLSVWFAPNERQAARWRTTAHYQELAERVQSDAVLSALYGYAAGKINWNEAKDSIASVLGEDTATS